MNSTKSILRIQLDEIDRIEEAIKITMHCAGLVGSVCMFAVYTRPCLRRLSLSAYFRVMAIVCFIQNTANLIQLRYHDEIVQFSEHLFFLFVYIQYLLVPISAWLELLASLDRFLSILFAYKLNFFMKPRFQYVSIASVIILNSILYIHNLLGVRLVCEIFNVSTRDIKSVLKLREMVFLVDLVTSSVAPFVVMTVLSVSTLVAIIRVHSRIKRSNQSSSSLSVARLLRDIRFGVTMIVLNSLFFVFVAPYRLNFIFGLNPFKPYSQMLANYVFDLVLNDVVDYYFILNFYFQLAVNSLVRREMAKLLRLVFQKLKTPICFTKN